MMRTAFLTFILFATVCVPAQERAAPSLGFDHVALSVANAEASKDFYVELFGMTNITDRDPIEGVRWLSMHGGGELHLLAIVDGEVRTNQAVHLAVKTPDFDDLMQRVIEMDVEYTTWLGEGPGVTERDDGTRQVYLKDPDGYWIEVIGVPN